MTNNVNVLGGRRSLNRLQFPKGGFGLQPYATNSSCSQVNLDFIVMYPCSTDIDIDIDMSFIY